MRPIAWLFVLLLVTFGAGYYIGYEKATVNTGEKEIDTVAEAAEIMGKIIGKWKIDQNPTEFIREIRSDGSFIEYSEGEQDRQGFWMVFTKEVPDPEFEGIMLDYFIYLSLAYGEGDKKYFEIILLDDENTLSLTPVGEKNGSLFYRIPQ